VDVDGIQRIEHVQKLIGVCVTVHRFLQIQCHGLRSRDNVILRYKYVEALKSFNLIGHCYNLPYSNSSNWIAIINNCRKCTNEAGLVLVVVTLKVITLGE
jgi:hypothetical protein